MIEQRFPPALLAILRGAREETRPWLQIASALRELERSGPVDETGRPWLQRAESESGYAANQLRRMTRVAEVVESIASVDPKLSAELTARPFSHVETLAKIWKLNENEARSLIEGRVPGNTYRDLQATYDRLSTSGHGVAPVVAGKQAAREFRDTAVRLFKSDTSPLSGGDVPFEVIRPIVPFRYATPDFYIVSREHDKVTRIEALDCYALYGGTHTEIALRKIITVATESSFFARFWIAVPRGESALVFLRETERLALTNVGVLVVFDSAIEWMIVPKIDSKPNPDRRHLWSDFDKARLRKPLR